MFIDFKNNIKKIRTTSPDYRRCLPEVTVRNHVWTVFPRIYTNLQSKVCFQFCFQVRRPVISTIVNAFMSFYEKSLPEYLIHENSKCHYFFISEKTGPKTDKFSNFLHYIQRVKHFSITKLDILTFCNILHLEMDFWNFSWKRIVSHKLFDKSLVKNTLNEISKKME